MLPLPDLTSLPAVESLLTTEVAATTTVFIVVAARLYFGSVVFAPRYAAAWNAARRLTVPILQRLIYQARWFPDVKIENKATKEEYVGAVDLTGQELALRIDGHRNVEIPLLAGFKTDWEGNRESATFVWYAGKPPARLPNWLSPYQIHVTCFRVGQQTRVTAHYEWNPWRLDRILDHLRKGESFSVKKGVERTKRALSDAEVTLTKTQLDQ